MNVGPWEIISRLGQGAMGSVYKATGPDDEVVALKVLHPHMTKIEEFVHRDLKPQNIILDSQGDAKVLDFGLAKDAQALASMLSMTGQSIGTPLYMSPEQCDGTKELDPRSDLYSLGATAYQMLTGRPPFAGPTATDYMRQHGEEIPTPAHKLNSGVPRNLSQVVERLLAKRPEDRHQTPAELIEDLNRVERGEVPLTLYKPRKSSQHSAQQAMDAATTRLQAETDMPETEQRVNREAELAEQQRKREAGLAEQQRKIDRRKALAAAQSLVGNEDRLDAAHTAAERALDLARRPEEEASAKTVITEVKGALGKGREYVAVMDFIVDPSVADRTITGTAVAGKLVQAVSGRFNLVTRDQIAKALTELKFSQGDLADKDKALELGKFVRARFLITGTVLQLGSTLTVGATMLDVQTGIVKQTAEFEAQAAGELSAQFAELARILLMSNEEKQKHLSSPRAKVEEARLREARYAASLKAAQATVDREEQARMEKTAVQKKAAASIGVRPGETTAVDLGGGIKLELVWIPPGEFLMGSPSSEEERLDNEIQHRVTLSRGFWMGKHEVTQEQWERVMGSNPSNVKVAKNPVEQVSWADTQEFMGKWCQDWYGEYPVDAVTDPTGPSSGSVRVLRGGSWIGNPGGSRSAFRISLDPSRRLFNRGFRVVVVSR